MLAVHSTHPARDAARLLKSLDQNSRDNPACACELGLECLAEMDARGVAEALGANAVNRVMRLCAGDEPRAEALFDRLNTRGLTDATSLQIISAARLSHGRMAAAAEATAALLVPALRRFFLANAAR